MFNMVFDVQQIYNISLIGLKNGKLFYFNSLDYLENLYLEILEE